jgi:hypothetical protein
MTELVRVHVVVDWRRQTVVGITGDVNQSQRWCRELIDKYHGDNLAGSQFVGLVDPADNDIPLRRDSAQQR